MGRFNSTSRFRDHFHTVTLTAAEPIAALPPAASPTHETTAGIGIDFTLGQEVRQTFRVQIRLDLGDVLLHAPSCLLFRCAFGDFRSQSQPPGV